MGIYIKGVSKDFIEEVLRAYPHNSPIEIVEVAEPHGRLIDEDEIKTVEVWRPEGHGVYYLTDFPFEVDAPTVIEAEGE